MSNPNKDLGRWLLIDVLRLKEGELVTMDMLDDLGINAVMFTKEDEGKYSIDFTKIDELRSYLQNRESPTLDLHLNFDRSSL